MSPQHIQILELAGWGFDQPVDRGSLFPEQLQSAACHARNKQEKREPYQALCPIHVELSNDSADLLANRNEAVANSGEFDQLAWKLAVVDLRRLIAFQRRIRVAGEYRFRIVDGADWQQLLDLALPIHAPTRKSPYMEVASYMGRWFLRDGYHRSFALLKHGINLVPAVVVDAETLAQMGAVGKQFFPEEVIFSSSPPMVSDFLDDEIVVRYIRPRHDKAEQASQKRVQKAGAGTPETLAKHKSAFTQKERDAVYRAIRERRDVRSGYLPHRLENDILFRLLSAAHMAPSVGLMQPWRFIVVRDAGLRAAVHDNFLRSNRKAAAACASDRRAAYGRLRLEGLLDAPQHLCVLCDAFSRRGHGLGRNSMPQTAAYSVACAIQNLWLAARAEGIGMGWVSILDPAALKELLHIPSDLELVAYLCLGYVESFSEIPDLERAEWEHREEIASLVKADYFDRPHSTVEVRQ